MIHHNPSTIFLFHRNSHQKLYRIQIFSVPLLLIIIAILHCTTGDGCYMHHRVSTSSCLVWSNQNVRCTARVGRHVPQQPQKEFHPMMTHYSKEYDSYIRMNGITTTRTRPSLMALSSTATAAISASISSSGRTIFDTTRIIHGSLQTPIISCAIAVTLLISALCGLLVEQVTQDTTQSRKDWRQFLPPSILVTLTTSATLVFIIRRVMSFQLPQQHFMYDFCWSTLLPSSLAFLLLSLPTSSPNKAPNPNHSSAVTTITQDETANAIQPQRPSALAAIQRMTIPFLMASTGSIIGCFVSFLLCYFNPDTFLSLPEAQQAVACLCASFIGGSINFFATSVIIQQPHSHSSTSHNSHALLSAMAAVDVVLMAFYFTCLSAAMQSKRLHRWFNDNDTSDVAHNTKNTYNMSDTIPGVIPNSISNVHQSIVHTVETKTSSKLLIAAILNVAFLTLVLVEISKRLERLVMKQFGVPGTACAFLAILVPWITTQIHNVSNNNTFWKTMIQHAETLSRLAFLFVFATMGCTADLSSTLYNGPACLFLSFTALIVHGIITLFGSLLFRRLLQTTRWSKKKINLTDVLIASNAAIGGPATAAAFCSEIKKSQHYPVEKSHLTIAATVWGVVGYAIGTTIGVTMFRILQVFV